MRYAENYAVHITRCELALNVLFTQMFNVIVGMCTVYGSCAYVCFLATIEKRERTQE